MWFSRKIMGSFFQVWMICLLFIGKTLWEKPLSFVPPSITEGICRNNIYVNRQLGRTQKNSVYTYYTYVLIYIYTYINDLQSISCCAANLNHCFQKIDNLWAKMSYYLTKIFSQFSEINNKYNIFLFKLFKSFFSTLLAIATSTQTNNQKLRMLWNWQTESALQHFFLLQMNRNYRNNIGNGFIYHWCLMNTS